MSGSINTSINNIYQIMSQTGPALNNVDGERALKMGSNLQQNIQEVISAQEKGSTETAKQTAYKLNVMV